MRGQEGAGMTKPIFRGRGWGAFQFAANASAAWAKASRRDDR